MPTATKETIQRGCVVNSSHQLQTVLDFFYGGSGREGISPFACKNTPDLFWRVDELGFHISGRVDGQDFCPSRDNTVTGWMRQPNLDFLVAEIGKWFAGLSEEKRSEMCLFAPIERAIEHFKLRSIGFCVRTTDSLDHNHEVLTITPAWVRS